MAPRKTTTKPAARKPKPIPPAPAGAAAAIAAAVEPSAQANEPTPPTAPVAPVEPAAAPAALAAVDPEAADGNNWTVEDGPRGRVVTLSRGEGPTMTFEEVLPAGAAPHQVQAAKDRILSRHKA